MSSRNRRSSGSEPLSTDASMRLAILSPALATYTAGQGAAAVGDIVQSKMRHAGYGNQSFQDVPSKKSYSMVEKLVKNNPDGTVNENMRTFLKELRATKKALPGKKLILPTNPGNVGMYGAPGFFAPKMLRTSTRDGIRRRTAVISGSTPETLLHELGHARAYYGLEGRMGKLTQRAALLAASLNNKAGGKAQLINPLALGGLAGAIAGKPVDGHASVGRGALAGAGAASILPGMILSGEHTANKAARNMVRRAGNSAAARKGLGRMLGYNRLSYIGSLLAPTALMGAGAGASGALIRREAGRKGAWG